MFRLMPPPPLGGWIPPRSAVAPSQLLSWKDSVNNPPAGGRGLLAARCETCGRRQRIRAEFDFDSAAVGASSWSSPELTGAERPPAAATGAVLQQSSAESE